MTPDLCNTEQSSVYINQYQLFYMKPRTQELQLLETIHIMFEVDCLKNT